eukprot:8153526-Pyramimonas_sp.AAC.1
MRVRRRSITLVTATTYLRCLPAWIPNGVFLATYLVQPTCFQQTFPWESLTVKYAQMRTMAA